MSFRAVTFDVGGTLIEPWPSVGHIYAEAAQKAGCGEFAPELLKGRFVAAWNNMGDFNYTRNDWARLVDSTFHGLTERPPSKTFFDNLYAEFATPALWRVFPDVLPAIEMLLSQGILLGIISNWDERLVPLLRELKLDTFFHSIIISCQAGSRKPQRAIFELAEKELGLPASEILHVGDSPSNDWQGARDSGFQARLLMRDSTITGPEQVCSLCDIAPGH